MKFVILKNGYPVQSFSDADSLRFALDGWEETYPDSKFDVRVED